MSTKMIISVTFLICRIYDNQFDSFINHIGGTVKQSTTLVDLFILFLVFNKEIHLLFI